MLARQEAGLTYNPDSPALDYPYHPLVVPAAKHIVSQWERAQSLHNFPTDGYMPGEPLYFNPNSFLAATHLPSLDMLTPEVVEKWGEKQILQHERGEPVMWQLNSQGQPRIQIVRNGVGFYEAFLVPPVHDFSVHGALRANEDVLNAYSTIAHSRDVH